MSGLVLYGVAIGAMAQASIGMDPWSVLAQGVASITGWSFGMVTNLIGLVVLALWIPLRQRPGIGTVLNVATVGSAADLGIWLIPSPTWLVAQIGLFVAGVVALGIATGIYLAPGLGAGPRDGLMTGLHSRTGWPIAVIRTAIEVTVLGLGFLLGGQVGLGTVIFAVMVGPVVHRSMGWFARRLQADLVEHKSEQSEQSEQESSEMMMVDCPSFGPTLISESCIVDLVNVAPGVLEMSVECLSCGQIHQIQTGRAARVA